MFHPLLLRDWRARKQGQFVSALSKMLKGDWVSLLFRVVVLGGCGSNRLASNQVGGRPLGNAQLGVDFLHLRNDKKF